ncbi:expressed unknown protein [Ectocarpus siliculosus]|uniref:Uncharacterized protein n=1 Tax=Ectocarpus siliculosus TaxID=2880 RepID=D8LF90_ECTSI|nr:expressed unknown protein [Ectocarpus siliculosus]|eukprot:CBN78815.1 expressed unknown protein [Ectocarpus siliculosus]
MSTESSGAGGGGVANDLRRNLLGEGDGFTDGGYSFSSLQSTSSTGTHPAGIGRSASGGGSSAGGGGGGGGGGGSGGGSRGVDELEMLIGNDNMHDIQDCMRTLQASPTHGSSSSSHHPDHHAAAPPAAPIGFYISSLDEAHHHNGDSGGGGSSGDMDVEGAGSRSNGGLGGGGSGSGGGGGDPFGQEEDSFGAAAALTSYDDEVGPKIGDSHQAVIPKLSSVTEDGTTLRSSPRPPPLQLWRPGALSPAALDLALPKPRPGGAGSAELEQKMRWKRNPEYAAWKCTDQLVGRRVAKRVETTHVREGAGQAKRFETLGMRRGWVVEKEDMLLHGRDEDMFVIRYPRMGVFQVKFEGDLGTLETMLVERSASDEDRGEEASAHNRPRFGARGNHMEVVVLGGCPRGAPSC